MSRSEAGDTIVEVLLAVALLSAILFTSWSIVNRSTQIGMAARQRVNIVSQMREQAEIIQSQRDKLGASFGTTITAGLQPTNPDDIGVNACSDAQMAVASPAIDTRRFHTILNTATGALQSKPGEYKSFNQLGSPARVWVQYVQKTGHIDFYIRGCWRSPGGQQNEDTSQFILRLNTT